MAPEQSPLSIAAGLVGDAGRALHLDPLGEVIDPELGVSIVDLGLVYDVYAEAGVAHVTMTLTAPGCPLGASLVDAVRSALARAPGVRGVAVHVVFDPPWRPDAMMTEEAKVLLGWRR